MKRTNLDDYRSLMDNVELPKHVKDCVTHAVAQASEAPQEEAASCDFPDFPARPEARHRRPWARVALAGACATVIAAALLFAGSSIPLPGQTPTGNTVNASLPKTGNFFTLAAYAAEQGEGASGQSATLEFKNFGSLGGWGCGTYDVETGLSHEEGDSPSSVGRDGTYYAQVRYALDLTCTGNNIQTVTYAIDGERVHFTSENRTYGPFGDENVNFEQQDSFTIAYDDQASDKAKMQRNLVAYFPVNERACEIQEILDEDAARQQAIYEQLAHDGESLRIPRSEHPELLSDEAHKELMDELGRIILRSYGDMLSQSPFTLTVTFDDGSTETKAYRIAPVEDFDQRLAAFQAEMTVNPTANRPTLYTITEIVEG